MVAHDRLAGAFALSQNTKNQQRWTAEEWLKLYDAYKVIDWDFTPDEWTEQQVADALAGLVPQWDDNENPSPSRKRNVKENEWQE